MAPNTRDNSSLTSHEKAMKGVRARLIKAKSFESRLWDSVSIPQNLVTDCWIWQKSTTKAGYSQIGKGKDEMVYVHRWVWEMFNGTVPDGLVVRHLCHNPRCCNIHHLSIGTQQDNLNDSARAGRMGKALSASQVVEIRKRLGTKPTSLIAKEFNVTRGAIDKIKTGRTWSQLEAV